jgi:hypothetical protein
MEQFEVLLSSSVSNDLIVIGFLTSGLLVNWTVRWHSRRPDVDLRIRHRAWQKGVNGHARLYKQLATSAFYGMLLVWLILVPLHVLDIVFRLLPGNG